MRIKWFSMVRVIGLFLVLLYHFFKTAFPGGFIGVDIFFTFSGYLITALLIDEYSRNKKIDLLGFYKRRFYRIVPPLILMILIVMPFTYLVRRDYVASIGSQVLQQLVLQQISLKLSQVVITKRNLSHISLSIHGVWQLRCISI